MMRSVRVMDRPQHEWDVRRFSQRGPRAISAIEPGLTFVCFLRGVDRFVARGRRLGSALT